MLVEAFIAELPVEALHMRVLHGLPRLNELQRDATVRDHRLQRGNDCRTGQAVCDADGEALARATIN